MKQHALFHSARCKYSSSLSDLSSFKQKTGKFGHQNTRQKKDNATTGITERSVDFSKSDRLLACSFLRAEYLHEKVNDRDDDNAGDNVLQRPQHELQQYQNHDDYDDNEQDMFHDDSFMNESI